MASLTNKQYRFAFILITSLFFLWGFAHNLDPILIPHLKRSFTLTTTQSTLIDTAVYMAYFIMAIPAGFVMKKYGYKTGIIMGLLTFAVGSFLFIPAANTQQYTFFLIALFIIACGLATLETAANPYASALGDAETATQRLNLSQSFNGLATALAPTIGAMIILTEGYSDDELNAMTATAKKLALASEASTVKMPYFILGSVLVVVAIAFAFTKLPDIRTKENSASKGNILRAFRHSNLSWGVAAQFFYVGAQTCVLSLFILYATEAAGIAELSAAYYLSACGFAFLAGRFLSTLVFMRFMKPHHLLTLYSAMCVLLCIVALICQGMVTIYAIIGISFFMSIMFPTIFSLGIANLGADREFGSSLIIMSIVGGAIIPRLFGYVADATGNIQYGYIVTLICFLVVMLFGIKGYKTTNNKIIKSPTVN
ncbi:L-fucose:H+ symporter permease [Mucilaginibacter myungsuensis]|uniref:L-fucose:H+ symporter permease n=1 Tax=Mucilaginibacter myungsuensis TaxID=649104 RepID=A0A929KZ75_9SPHI|nr:L-fucose:H+ symporter permease [Mucilaginibacter myungsuensis]MBE9661574.1 L-fucose:H+ symporter permease [Mucilaginibacter myungsuensis]MDN3597717.1 L-fucose:H+ symporter permease [Mucilaginibacter myungsuensis]